MNGQLTTSLWTDELHSVLFYSGKGPLTAVTTYGAANNHVLYNLLNSLTPGVESLDPVAVRAWSILAVLATLGLILYEFFRRRWFLTGAVAFFFAANTLWLELSMQGRGYGIEGLAAVVVTIGLLRYLEEERERWLVVMAVATVLGTWAIPTFVVFAGSLVLLLAALTRSIRVVFFGALAAAGIVVVHLPIIVDMLHAADEWNEQVGRIYRWSDARVTFDRWFTPLQWGGEVGGPAQLASLIVLLVLPALTRVGTEVRRLVYVVVAALVIFMGVALLVGSTVDRTTAFIGLPYAIAALVLVSSLLYRPDVEFGRLLVTAVVTLYLAGTLATNIDDYRFTVREDFEGASEFVSRVVPTGTEVSVTSSFHFMDAYLDGEYAVTLELDPAALASGQQVLVDMNFAPPTFDPGTLPELAVEHRMPQLRGEYLRILLAPPVDNGVAEVRVPGGAGDLADAHDRDPATTVELPTPTATLRVEPEVARSRALLIALADGTDPASVEVMVEDAAGATRSVPEDDILSSPGSITVLLDDAELSAVDLTVDAGVVAGGPVTVRDLWVTAGD